MARFRAGLSVTELAEEFLADEESDAARLIARYGRDTAPRFAGAGESDNVHMRPTLRHLRSPMYRDAEGREYTPHEPHRTDTWWVVIPLGATRRQRAAVAAGSLAVSDVLSFPLPGDTVTLSRVYRFDGAGIVTAETHVVRVLELVAPKQASAQVVFEREIDAEWTARERSTLDRRAAGREERAVAAAAAADNR